jgi:hypothetical protein
MFIGIEWGTLEALTRQLRLLPSSQASNLCRLVFLIMTSATNKNSFRLRILYVFAWKSDGV